MRIGEIEISGRLAMAPIDTQYCTKEGYVTSRMINFYWRRAQSGVPLIITENTGVHPGGKSNFRMHGLFDDSYIHGAKSLVSEIKRSGSKVLIQLNHAGRQTTYSYLGGIQPVAPSAISCPLIKVKPRALEEKEIEHLVLAFFEAAQRAWRAGADGVELHMAHGYLLCSFLSPFSNLRSDKYGGTFEGRLRFPLEVLRSIRENLPSSFVVGCRISADEEVPRGLTLTESVPTAQALEAAGADYIHVSACNNGSAHKTIPSYFEPLGVFSRYAKAIKKAVSIPVICVGRFHNLECAEAALRFQVADLVASARPFLVDPDFAAAISSKTLPPTSRAKSMMSIAKGLGVLSGQKCLSCNRCIASLVTETKGLTCTINPFVGENMLESEIFPAKERKRVLVVGGGPAGIISALLASMRGHRVFLWEATRRLGGALYYAGLAPHKEPFKEYLDYLIRRLHQMSVDVLLEKVGDIESIREFRADHVILAVGGAKPTPLIPGMENTEWLDVLKGFETPYVKGLRILVVGGGGRGVELSMFLALKGAEVTLLEARSQVGENTPLQIRYYLEQKLISLRVKLLLNAELRYIENGKFLIKGQQGEKTIEGFEKVFVAFGEKPNRDLYEALLKAAIPTVLIGDALRPRDLLAAVHEGATAGLLV
jgi:2,4-dienoyl-CoA reductase-like NADH-dependent reductase (Old Yellow Enzyme family)/thioredoxin reductase